MNSIFESFINKISSGDMINAYSLLENEFNNATDQKTADILRQVLTSHFIKERSTKLNGLIQLKKNGFHPEVVLDIGAQIGTPELYAVYPDSYHVFIEPVTECIDQLNNIAKSLTQCVVINAAASNFCGSTNLSITSSRQYSSITDSISDESRAIEVITVDSVIEKIPNTNSILLKVDVDGAEINVLQGSKKTLNKDSVVIVEASMADTNPRFGEVVELMNDYGYYTYDIVDPLYRPSDWHLWQVDLIFIKKDSKFWGSKTTFN